MAIMMKVVPTKKMDQNFPQSFTFTLALSILFTDGSGDKKASTGAGADFNPAFVSFLRQ